MKMYVYSWDIKLNMLVYVVNGEEKKKKERN